jgi:hypothetical protein
LLYHKIFSTAKELIENNFSQLLLPDSSEFISCINGVLSFTLENKIDFKVGIVSLHDKLEEDYIQLFGSLSLVLIEILSLELKTNLKYFGIVYDGDTSIIRQENYKPLLSYFLSETVNKNKATFCKIHDFEPPILDRYNVEMQNTEDSFIDKVVDCMENIELVNDSYTKIDEFGKERKYIDCGFRYAYDGYVKESIDLEQLHDFVYSKNYDPVKKAYNRLYQILFWV